MSIASGPSHTLFINSNLKALSFGHNDNGQCGQIGLTPLNRPTLIEHLKNVNIVQVACGEKHSLFLTEDNKVYACGSNEHGQLGMGSRLQWYKMAKKPNLISYYGSPIKKIGCGRKFSVLLDSDGHLHTCGSSKFGQLGM